MTHTSLFAHEVLYTQLVNFAGTSANLLTVLLPRQGHCNFEPAEPAQAFGDLVLWVKIRNKPSPQRKRATKPQ